MTFVRMLAVVLLAGIAGAARAEPLTNQNFDALLKTWSDEPIEKLTGDVEQSHPVAVFILAKRLFAAGRRDEAVFWYYEGELRWRACLVPSPIPAPSEADMFAIFHGDLGSVIRPYSFGDVPGLLRTLDKVLAWDAGRTNDCAVNEKAKDDARLWMKRFAADLAAHQDEIK